jgi:hypothetical protein
MLGAQLRVDLNAFSLILAVSISTIVAAIRQVIGNI